MMNIWRLSTIMSELEEFINYLTGNRYEFSQEQQKLMGNLAYIIREYLREKAKPKGFHGDCTSPKHSIGTSYCPECLP